MALTKVSTDGVKNDAINSNKIPANAVGASELADNAVDTNAIANNAVTADKLPNSGITLSKIQNISQDRILGRQSSGSGVLQELNAGNVRLMLNVADGANQTTINNNADNRVITGSGTANTLNAESNVTINSDGDLLIGRTSTIDTSEVLGLQGPSGDHCTLGLTCANNTSLGIIAFNDSDANFRGQIRYSHQGDVMQFQTANSERIRLDSDGLKFNGDTAAANALDDYEEGEYTPALSNGQSFFNTSYDRLRYTKIGRQVTLTGQLVFAGYNSSDFSNTFTIGLPFLNGDGGDRSEYLFHAGIGYFNPSGSSSPSSGYQPIGFYAAANSSHVSLYAINPNTDTTIGNWVGSGSDIWVNLTYFTDA